MSAPERTLKPWAQAEADDFHRWHGDGNCSCHISPPCCSCTHPGNPLNLEEDDDAWEFSLDYEVHQAMRRIGYHIEREAERHLKEMKQHHEPAAKNPAPRLARIQPAATQ